MERRLESLIFSPHSRKNSKTREIDAGGTKLLVSVERPEDTNLQAEIATLDEGDLDEEELAALADEDVSVPVPPGV